jgi:hypothetical protein
MHQFVTLHPASSHPHGAFPISRPNATNHSISISGKDVWTRLPELVCPAFARGGRTSDAGGRGQTPAGSARWAQSARSQAARSMQHAPSCTPRAKITTVPRTGVWSFAPGPCRRRHGDACERSSGGVTTKNDRLPCRHVSDAVSVVVTVRREKRPVRIRSEKRRAKTSVRPPMTRDGGGRGERPCRCRCRWRHMESGSSSSPRRRAVSWRPAFGNKRWSSAPQRSSAATQDA